MNREEAHKLVDQLFDGVGTDEVSEITIEAKPDEERKLPEGKRVVRTKTSGDRVYLIDEVAKTRAWVTSGEVLQGLGFDMDDVKETDDADLLHYNMSSAIYKLDA